MITPLARLFFSNRVSQIEKFNNSATEIQKAELQMLIKKARNTVFGKEFHFIEITDYQKFAENVPVQSYEQIQGYVERMLKAEPDVLWPGLVKWFAQSSGTTDAKSKFIPVSDESYRSMHIKGGADTIAMYLHLNPKSKFFSGRSLAVAAGECSINEYGLHIGMLSGMLNERMNPVVKLVRVPAHKTCMIKDFTEKMEATIPEIITKNVVSFSGIPSWYQILFSRVMEVTGKTDLAEIWPNMELFIHGGVSFDPYREMFIKMFPSKKLNFLEVFNASEGFFAMQNDFSDPGMLLMLDYGTFYEFVDTDNENAAPIPLWEVKVGKSYAMIITNNSGLWRYNIGDVVTFTSVNPYKIVISGRTKHFLNLCGEELMVGNADAAITGAAEACGVHVLNYTATVVPPTDHEKARHQWLIEFKEPPSDPVRFQKMLDKLLCDQNSDYESKRNKNVALEIPEVVIARQNLFMDWLVKHGKTGGQQKIPRLQQKRDIMDDLLSMN